MAGFPRLGRARAVIFASEGVLDRAQRPGLGARHQVSVDAEREAGSWWPRYSDRARTSTPPASSTRGVVVPQRVQAVLAAVVGDPGRGRGPGARRPC